MAGAGMLQQQIVFDGTEDKYDLWETRFLSRLHILKLKDTILREPTGEAAIAADPVKNADCYAQLVNALDDKSLSLIRHDGADDGRKALKLLREHYSGKSKPKILNLYTSLTTIKMEGNETVTDYMIRAENIISALRDAGENMSDGLLVATILNGLPDSFRPLAVHVTQNEDNLTFKDFKRRLRVYEESEKMRTTGPADSVMKTNTKQSKQGTKTHWKEGEATLTCYKCGEKGHIRTRYTKKVWCSHCKSNTHSESLCRKKGKDGARKVAEEKEDIDEEHQCFMAKHATDERPSVNVKKKGIMMDAGATSYIVNDIAKFKSFDNTFQPDTHSIELADGTKCSGMAQRRETALIYPLDNEGRQQRAQLQDALYIPTYPHDIFSVARATNGGATVTFKKGDSHMITKKGDRFDFYESGNLFYLPTVQKNVDKCNMCHDMQTWHEILGHCNYEDVQKLMGVVRGMKIRGSAARPTQLCEICAKGKFTQTRNREPDRKATEPLQLVHTDLAGPMRNPSLEGHKYAQSFTDDYSGAMTVYFLKCKSDAVHATERFLADSAPFGEVKCLRSDNGTEFTSKEFKALLTKNKIKHETSAPYSPHQNGTAERSWRTLYEMGRCMLFDSELPDKMWNYAVQTAAYVRNRCYSKRTKKTPYEMLTGKRPDMSKLQKFGTVCFAYTQEKGKLDPRCEQGRFIGYDKNSPAYLVYYPDIEMVQKHRLVKFTNKTVNEKETQTHGPHTEYQDREVHPRFLDSEENNDEKMGNASGQSVKDDVSVSEIDGEQSSAGGQERKNPPRVRRRPVRLQEYDMEDTADMQRWRP
ncbi:copia protein isoform X1 [Nerophis ophidion]|uniref:copia protein isoform X1 n=1 Tax=Nerophis ophidion TaxID=159077 RepID=UPI002AE02814|nr:copia protein isoform X1 [Nerophis ophidion]